MPRLRRTLGPITLAGVVLVLSAIAPAAAEPANPTPPPDPPVSAGAPAANPALINPDASTTLHLTKYEGAPVDQAATPADGTQRTIAGRDTLAGAQFQIARVCQGGADNPAVDLTTNDGWADASRYRDDLAAAATDRCTAGPAQVATTDSAGQITFSGLPVGLYYVEELSAPPGFTRAVPFVVTLPMTDPLGRTSWMYEVYVYPKNAADTITKSVRDERTQSTDSADGPGANHTLTFTVRSTMTDGRTTASDIGRYEIIDDLDPRLTLQAVSVAIDPDGDPATTSVTPLTQGNDYTLSISDPGGGRTRVRLSMTLTGLAELAAAKAADAEAVVVTTLTTTLGSIQADGTTRGIVPDTAHLVPNDDWVPPGPGVLGIASNEVESRYGDVQVLKYDAVAGTDTPLSGAVFSVYLGASGPQACPEADMTASRRLLAATTPTGAQGRTTISGLQTSDFYDGATQTSTITYCLLETQTPPGFELAAQPIPFTVPSNGAGGPTPLSTVELRVPNEAANLTNRLPATGGGGVVWFAAAGLGLVLAGFGLRRAARRRPARAGCEPSPTDRP